MGDRSIETKAAQEVIAEHELYSKQAKAAPAAVPYMEERLGLRDLGNRIARMSEDEVRQLHGKVGQDTIIKALRAARKGG